LPNAQLVSNLRETTQVLGSDLRDYLKHRPRKAATTLSAEEQRALDGLRRDGYAVVEGFWPREKALAVRDRLEQYLEPAESREFESGAYIRFWDNHAYDEGVRRLYHVEREVPELAAFRYDKFCFDVVNAYYGVPFHSGVLMYQHNTRSNANTRYYHVDVFSKEFKTFLYLDDVDAGNGPFTYLPGTHKSHFRRLKKQLFWNGEGAATSFSDADLGPALDREVQICGPAGTLILADVRGFHRGSPQLERSRSALVNYLYRDEGDLFLDR
jgi:hypothetical protein